MRLEVRKQPLVEQRCARSVCVLIEGRADAGRGERLDKCVDDQSRCPGCVRRCRRMTESLRPLESRARWAVIGLVAVMVSDVLAIGSDLLEIRLMDRLIAGKDVSASSLDSDDIRQGVVAILQVVAYVGAIVFFLRWFHRAYSNLAALGSRPRFGRGWALGGWFVPILWWWRPKQIANDIWRGNDPDVRSRNLLIGKTAVPPLLTAWWIVWLISNSVNWQAGLLWWDVPTAIDAGTTAALGDTVDAEAVRDTAIVDAVSSGIDVAAAVLAVLVVRKLSARQYARERVVASLPETPHQPAT